MRRTPLHPAILGITPLHRPDPRLAIAICRAGALGAVDLGRDAAAARAALRSVAEVAVTGLGVRVHPGYEPRPEDLPESIEFVIAEACGDLARWGSRRVFARAVSLEEAEQAVAAGAAAVIASGHEGGGRVGEESTFVLLQRLLAKIDAPVWAHGGIGLHTAAACAVGGAAGVVIDGQLALARESTLPDEIRRAIAAMDGTETTLIAGRRVFTRPDLPRIEELRDADAASVDRALGGDDLRGQLVPVGQDGAFARSLAESHATAGGIVQALSRGIATHVAAARERRPLAP
ncbi:MAG TPA: nitronate monooxygenase, partial [Gemmatimonadota bacterium]|nr:nitronate monooxygenase [Gemmatimonadota bacterium]